MYIFYKKCSWNTTQDIVFVFVINPHNLCFTNSILPQPPYSVKQKIEIFLKFFLWCIINHGLLSKTIIFLSMSNFVTLLFIKISTQCFATHFKTPSPFTQNMVFLNSKKFKYYSLIAVKINKKYKPLIQKTKKMLVNLASF